MSGKMAPGKSLWYCRKIAFHHCWRSFTQSPGIRTVRRHPKYASLTVTTNDNDRVRVPSIPQRPHDTSVKLGRVWTWEQGYCHGTTSAKCLWYTEAVCTTSHIISSSYDPIQGTWTSVRVGSSRRAATVTCSSRVPTPQTARRRTSYIIVCNCPQTSSRRNN